MDRVFRLEFKLALDGGGRGRGEEGREGGRGRRGKRKESGEVEELDL